MAARLTNQLCKSKKGQNCSSERLRYFTFTEIDGVKVVNYDSNSTSTAVSYEGPALQLELLQAMTYSQRSQQRLGHTVEPFVLRQKFPTLDKYCDDDQVQVIACSEVGNINPRKQAVQLISERLQIPPATIDRYFRTPTSKKTKSRATAKKRRKS